MSIHKHNYTCGHVTYSEDNLAFSHLIDNLEFPHQHVIKCPDCLQGKKSPPYWDIDEYGQYTVDHWFSADENQDPLRSLFIMSLGLAGETGEVCEKIKKFVRDGNDDMELLKKELGDVIFYWARICRHFNLTPSDVIATNIKKLDDRRARGVSRGSGDNR